LWTLWLRGLCNRQRGTSTTGQKEVLEHVHIHFGRSPCRPLVPSLFRRRSLQSQVRIASCQGPGEWVVRCPHCIRCIRRHRRRQWLRAVRVSLGVQKCLLQVVIRGRCRIRRGYIVGRDGHRRRWRGACLAIRQSPRPLRRLDGRLGWRDNLHALLGLSVLCLGRSCGIPVLASVRIRPTCHRRMLTLWNCGVTVVYCAVIRWPACLGPAEGVSRHSSGMRGSRSSLKLEQRLWEVEGRMFRETFRLAGKERSPTVSPEDLSYLG
jgi:hypothetical protein